MGWAMAILLLAGFSCFAEDRALIVGIGRYADTRNNLPGIDKDVARAQELAGELGFRESQVHVLTNEAATDGALRHELATWLGGAGADDRTFFYYSGHGSLMTDPAGQVVGILAPHDLELRNGKLWHALPGPELGSLFRQLASRHLLVVVDACHSGRLTDSRGMGNGVVAKVFRYQGMPAGHAGLTLDSGVESKGIAIEDAVNYVLLAACRRDEIAGATTEGSILTMALAETLRRMVTGRDPVTMQAAHDAVLNSLAKNSAVERRQHPEISGSIALDNYDWAKREFSFQRTTPVPDANTEEDWEFLQTLYRRRDGNLPIDIGKNVYRAGERMSITIQVPADGYINIVSMGRGDEAATVLFPNGRARDNHVSAGQVVIPGDYAFSLEQELAAAASRQENEVIVVFTTNAANFYQEGVGSAVFRNLGERTRGTVVKPANHFAAGFATYTIGH